MLNEQRTLFDTKFTEVPVMNQQTIRSTECARWVNSVNRVGGGGGSATDDIRIIYRGKGKNVEIISKIKLKFRTT